MSKASNQKSRKPRFEILEDRLLLTTWNVAAKFNANGSGAGGEAAFGDDATNAEAFVEPTEPSGYENNNYGTGPKTASDTATSTSPWSFGVLDSGFAADLAMQRGVGYTFSTAVDPNSFDNYFGGTTEAPWSPGAGTSEFAYDGYLVGEPFADDKGLGLFTGGTGHGSVVYNYGNSGLNGDGSESPVLVTVEPLGAEHLTYGPGDPGVAVAPTGTMFMSSAFGATDSRFTAPSGGTYTFTATLTDPNFDPFDGPAGGNYTSNADDGYHGNANDAWTWVGGQPDFVIFKTPSGSTTATNTSSILADGFFNDINAVNAGESPTSVGATANNLGIIGQTYTVANGGLDINPAGGTASPSDTGLPYNGTSYNYGSGGTWSLTNVGPIAASPSDVDLTGDEYDMSWTVTQTVSLAAGDSINIVTNPRYEQSFVPDGEGFEGDQIAPTYISAEVTNDTPVPLQSPPVVANSIGTALDQTNQSYAFGYPVAVDAGLTVTSTDTDITGATVIISQATFASGDLLNFTNQNGISGSYDSATGVLTLSGSATPAQYTAALQSVTFSTSTSSTVTGTRIIEVVADDSDSFPTYSNTAYDTVQVPELSANQASVNDTAGQTVTVDAPLTIDYGPVQIAVYGADVSGATMTIGTGYQSSDTLHFTNQNGITGSYSGGVLTLSGGATPAQYQTALDSVTFSSTSTSTATRNISMELTYDGLPASNAAATQINVSAPVTISGVYISGSAWTSLYKTYLSTHSLGSSTMGYAMKTGGTATTGQLATLPWANLNTIDVQFSGPVTGITTGSVQLVGGTGSGAIAAPTITAVSSLGGNAYQISLSGSLGNNKYVLAVASTGSSFGPAVVDANGGGISGTFTTSTSSFPSGNGLAGSTFDYFFNVLPGDHDQNGLVNAADTTAATDELNYRTTTSGYNYLVDYKGAGFINTNDVNIDTSHLNNRQTTITAPTAPSAGLVGGSGFTALALGVQESGMSPASGSPPAIMINALPAASPAASTTPASGAGPGDAGSDSTPDSTTGSRDHGRHQFAGSGELSRAATDEAVANFDLADLRLY